MLNYVLVGSLHAELLHLVEVTDGVWSERRLPAQEGRLEVARLLNTTLALKGLDDGRMVLETSTERAAVLVYQDGGEMDTLVLFSEGTAQFTHVPDVDGHQLFAKHLVAGFSFFAASQHSQYFKR